MRVLFAASEFEDFVRVGGLASVSAALSRALRRKLMPSRYEPCGLSQMNAQRFGSLPIGYRTGGLSDTIVDGKTGFLFKRCSAEGLLGAVCRAFATFGSKSRLHSMRKLAMAQPFGWDESARAYRNLYGDVARAAAS